MGHPLNCIIAVSQNMGICKNGDLPWSPLRKEFNYFRRMTTTSSVKGKQNLVIMDRKIWFSIPEKNRPLKDRINLVLSRELKEPPAGAHFLVKSLDDALKLIEQPELTKINFSQNIQVFSLMSRKRKALSTNLKYMKRMI
ncbi:Dihydrofolate reductase, partial [Galemys pyrenaicus]